MPSAMRIVPFHPFTRGTFAGVSADVELTSRSVSSTTRLVEAPSAASLTSAPAIAAPVACPTTGRS
jgi:hypothetical protein